MGVRRERTNGVGAGGDGTYESRKKTGLGVPAWRVSPSAKSFISGRSAEVGR